MIRINNPRINNPRNTLILVLCLITVACSATKKQVQESPEVASSKTFELIDFYVARGQLLKNEYEHYIISGQSLVAQCGQLSKTDGSKPSVTVTEERVETLSREQLQNISSLLDKVKETHSTNTAVYPPAEETFVFNSPGISELIFKADNTVYNVKTSLDAVVDRKTESLSSTRDLLSELRELAPKLCGNTRFFGI